MTSTYEKAYTEVSEILKHLPKYELKKIPQDKIEFYNTHKDESYIYKFDTTKPINEQNISIEANAIIVSLFRNYFASNKQREILDSILVKNDTIVQQKLREKYNPDNIFKNTKNRTIQNSGKKESEKIGTSNNVSIIEYKENIFTKIINKIKNILKK